MNLARVLFTTTTLAILGPILGGCPERSVSERTRYVDPHSNRITIYPRRSNDYVDVLPGYARPGYCNNHVPYFATAVRYDTNGNPCYVAGDPDPHVRHALIRDKGSD